MASVRELMKGEKGYYPEIWEEIAKLGWLGLAFPPDYGGAGGSYLDLLVLIEEMGRVVFPGPFFSTVILGGLPILIAGNENQKKKFLPSISKGELLATLAIAEEDVSFDSSGINMKATPDKDGFILSGTKLFVPEANLADLIICAARTNPAQETDDGITLFLVYSKRECIECTVLKPWDGSKQCKVVFHEVKVPASDVLGTVDKGWGALKRILQFATVAKCAEMLGSAELVLAMTVQYSRDRVQFDKAIGSFQVQQQRCADMFIDVDGMRLTTYQAGWMLNEDIPCTKEVAIAKAWASEALKRVVLAGLRLHGATGFMNDHDISVHYRKACASEFYFGDANFHKDIICQELNIG